MKPLYQKEDILRVIAMMDEKFSLTRDQFFEEMKKDLPEVTSENIEKCKIIFDIGANAMKDGYKTVFNAMFRKAEAGIEAMATAPTEPQEEKSE